MAVALGYEVHAERPYWIAVSVSAVLQGQTLFVSARRAVERAAGTAVGVVLAATILALKPAAAVVLATIVLLQFATEAVIVASYAVAVVFITPLTLLLSELAARGTVTG